MVRISFPATESVFVFIGLLVRVIVWVRNKRIDWKREAILLLMFINLGVIIRFVLFPRDLVDGHIQPLIFDPETALPLRINLVPFIYLFDYESTRDMVWNILGNVVMFIPTGIILPIVYKKLDRFWKVAAVGALISFCTEILQLPFGSRASDVDDLIMNTLGVIIGYGIYALIRSLIKTKRS